MILLGELLVVDRDLLGVGQRVEHEAGAHRLLGGLAGLGVELLARAPLGLQELGELVLVVVEAVDGVVHGAVDLGLDDALGQRHVRGVDDGLEDLVAGLADLLHAAHPAEPLAQVGGQLVERVELAGQLGELVVGRRAAGAP
jgi:hypothetical protein